MRTNETPPVGSNVVERASSLTTRTSVAAAALVPLALAIFLVVDRSPDRATPGGSSCSMLFELAEAADNCDPKLLRLASITTLGPDSDGAREHECARIWSNLVREDASPSPHAQQSLFQSHASALELDRGARERVFAQLSGQLVVEPKRAIRPGHALAQLRIDGQVVRVDDQGRSASFLRPGRHDLEVYYSGHKTEYCVTVGACQRVDVSSAGPSLEGHTGLEDGRCDHSQSQLH